MLGFSYFAADPLHGTWPLLSLRRMLGGNMQSSQELSALFPGAMTKESGYYRINHSTGHHPETQTYLGKYCHLPKCPVRGCVVAFRLVPVANNRLNNDWISV